MHSNLRSTPASPSFRQIRDTVNLIFCEQMLVCYITVFRDTFWPFGKLAPHVKVRTDSERSETKERAQQKLLDNIPGRTRTQSVKSLKVQCVNVRPDL